MKFVKNNMLLSLMKYLAVIVFGVLCIWKLFESRQYIQYEIQCRLEQDAIKMYSPALLYSGENEMVVINNWLLRHVLGEFPVVVYSTDIVGISQQEDGDTIKKILESQANDENEVSQDGKVEGEVKGQEDQPVPVLDEVAMDNLRDFDYLLSNFYIVDSTTMIGPEQLDADALLTEDLRIDTGSTEPKVLIFHTHSQEMFADSVEGDLSTGIVGVGEYLTQLLNAKGIVTIHDSGVYDIIDGKLDRSNAYENAEASIRPILEANPSIEVVIDLHRDGVAEDTHLVTDINGKQTARIMYFNGLSRTRMNGDISYLYNPYIQDNLAFSLKMELCSEKEYPGFSRKIYLGAYRYNLHLVPRSLLIEAGAQTNTQQEMDNAMEVLADILEQVLTGTAP